MESHGRGTGTLALVMAILLVAAGCSSPVSPDPDPPEPEKVATPTFGIPAGTYDSDQAVAVACSTTGAVIHVTTDGIDPTASSPVYAGPIAVAGSGMTLTIKALAVKSGHLDSAIASATFSIVYKVATPVFDPPAGSYAGTQSVAITTSTGSASIRYTTDGTDPTSSSGTVYGGPVSVPASASLKAIAYRTGYDDSEVATAAYAIYAPGDLDPSFQHVGTGLDGSVLALGLQADGRVVVGGSFSSYDGSTRYNLARLDSDGSLDATFGGWGTALAGTVRTVAFQDSGRIIIGGDFTQYSSGTAYRVARLNVDGSLDATFLTGSDGPNARVHSIACPIGDDRVYIGGEFSRVHDVARRYMARLDSDTGTLDTTFLADMADGPDDHVYVVTAGNMGTILVGGKFTTITQGATPQPRGHVARLNSNGSLDTTFTTSSGGANGNVHAIALQANGRILIGGDFTTYNGTSRGCIARLNSDGSLDTSFVPTGTGLNARVRSIALQADGRILVGGDFTSYNGTVRNYVARLNADGTLDTTFPAVAAGTSYLVQALVRQPDGRILVGGDFVTYGGVSRKYIARIWN